MGWFFGDNNNKEASSSTNNEQNSTVIPQNKIQFTQHHSSYSTSKSCHTDPDDDQFMICQEKINQNGKIQTKETRVPVSETVFGGMGGLFGTLFKGFDDSAGIIDSRVNQMQKDFHQDANLMLNAFLPFMSIIDPKFDQASRFFQNNPSFPNRYQNIPAQPQRNSPSKMNDNPHYFSSADRDYEIRDL